MPEKSQPLIVAIDGPAASGKSTVAKRVAARLGLIFVNSGAMYRAFTFHTLQSDVDPSETESVLDLLAQTEFQSGKREGIGTIAVNGTELTAVQLSSPEVNDHVSIIAKIPEVRERLVAEQRKYGAESGAGVVMEGRDIGSVVFPDSPHKFYIDASPEVRAQRRRDQGIDDEIEKRDRVDSSRKTAPLKIAEDAQVIDTSAMEIDEVVEKILENFPSER
ncbi:MAG: (d)CMP kinase [Verrucomicrobiales bacterium]|nr:(d)CMP kinase [Verrucomicrobiales bacterium]